MGKVYGYVRISTRQQNMERQVRNILAVYPQAVIIREIYTGTKFQGRKELEKILKQIQPGDTIVFDAVSRMSRNAKEGFQLYEELFHRGITLVFLREPYINTEVYKQAVLSSIPMTGTNVDLILEGLNKYLLKLAEEQIRIAFEQAEKEVEDLRQRTREGMETARRRGKQIGQKKGASLTTRKSVEAKEILRKHCVDFGGCLTDAEVQRLAGVSRNTFYKYKREIRAEITGGLPGQMDIYDILRR